MKTWKATIYLKSGTGGIQTTVQAKTLTDARKLLEAQYGASLRMIGAIQEVK
ncbi:MAG: hypothetical protein V4546_00900 [Bacteroidota bacterium]